MDVHTSVRKDWRDFDRLARGRNRRAGTDRRQSQRRKWRTTIRGPWRSRTVTSRQAGAHASYTPSSYTTAGGRGRQNGYQPQPCQPNLQQATSSIGLIVSIATRAPFGRLDGRPSARPDISAPPASTTAVATRGRMLFLF